MCRQVYVILEDMQVEQGSVLAALKVVPAEKYGLQVISMGFLTADEAPIIWRGPMLHGALQQFFREVAWKNLDYLVIDLPPGTGDVALSLSQTVPVAGAIVVTTPQQVSLADTRRAVAMYRKLNIPPLGIIENMSYFVCPGCSHEADIFGHGGGERIHGRRGTHGGTGVDRKLQPSDDSVDGGAMTRTLQRRDSPRNHESTKLFSYQNNFVFSCFRGCLLLAM